MVRVFDILLSFLGILVSFPLLVAVYVVLLLESDAPIFRQERVGKFMVPFYIFKFRTMRLSTANLASHLNSAEFITPLGKFLRKTKIDELPQLFNVLIGDMSLVGPRPNLYNQLELCNLRSDNCIYDSSPGITGLAQIYKVDMSTPSLLLHYDRLLVSNFSVGFYIWVIFKTVLGSGYGDRIK